MNSTLKKSFFFVLVSFCINSIGYNQEFIDNPNYDQVPIWLLDSMANREARASTVVTIDGWDNIFVGQDNAEGHISENPQHPQQYFTVFNTDNSHYTMNGFDWEDSSPSWGGVTIRGDVLSAYDSLGNLFFENMYGAGSIQGCKVVVSQNNGQTWGAAVTAINGVDKNWMAADQTAGPYANYVYTTMTASSGGNFARSIDHGATWTQTNNFSTQGLPGMMVCVGAYQNVQGGAVYVVTNGGSTTASTYTFYRSLDGGSTFSQMSSQNFSGFVGSFVNNRHSVNNMRTRPYPFIAADNSYGPNRGRLYLVYAKNDPPGEGNNPDIWSRYSDDGGANWSNAKRVNDGLTPTQSHQFMPAIWCDKETGRLYIQWMDSREDPANQYAKIYATFSDDGGQTYMPNQRISNEEMIINCTSCPGSGNPRYQGDYNGIISNSQVSQLCWADFRDGDFDSYVAYFPDFAMVSDPPYMQLSILDTIWVYIPDEKLYDNSVLISTDIEQPTTGTISFSYPNGFVINNIPDSLPVVITATPDVPLGLYDVIISARGPNGTPVHRRTTLVQKIPMQAPVADFYADNTSICAGDSVNFFDLSSNLPDSWDWSFPGGQPDQSSDQNPENIVYDTPGIYDVSLMVTNTSGSDTKIETDYITISAQPNPPGVPSDEVCEGEPVPDLVATGTNIQWFDDPELTNLVHEGNQFSTGLTDPGSYTFYVTQTVNGCVSAPAEAILIIYQLPDVSFEDLPDLCIDAEPLVLTGGSPEGGNYSGIGVIDGIFYPDHAGAGLKTIIYVYTDEHDCTNSATQTIIVFDLPDVTFDEIPELCFGDPAIELTQGNPEGGTYSGEGVDNGYFDPSVTGSGTYIITYDYTDFHGCTNFATQEIVVNVLPSVEVTEDKTICGDNSAILEATSPTAVEYLWTPGDYTTATIEVDSTGIGYATQVFIVSVWDENDCMEQASVSVTFIDCTGIDENSEEMSIAVYPNPSDGSFTLELESKGRSEVNLSVINYLGVKTLSETGISVKGKYQRSFNLNNLATGLYIIIIDDGEQVWQQKLIIGN